jgi:tetratricopeptide (TPR) repeat protein
VSLSRSTGVRRNDALCGIRRTITQKGAADRAAAGIDNGRRLHMLRAMAAVAYELPPLTTLTLVRDDVAASLAGAEALVAAGNHATAVGRLDELWAKIRHDPALALRQRLALAWAEMYCGNLGRAAELLEHAEGLAQSPRFDATERADVLYRRGCVALKRSDVAEATSFFTRAIDLNLTAARPRMLLEAHCREWRSRCYQFVRDWDAAARDAERALELATKAGDEESQAHALFQASLVAERQREWLVARCYAEQALTLYRKHGDRLATARLLNNIGGIRFLLGDVDGAESTLLEAVEAADAAASDADLAQSVNSLAQVYLRAGRPADARVRALRAVEILDGREDFRDELGSAQLVIGQALAAEGDDAAAHEWLDAAEGTFLELGSTSHLANTWVARGDVLRATDVDAAADAYRRAADVLRDMHF